MKENIMPLEEFLGRKKNKAKYRSKKTIYNSVTYDSEKEARRAAELDVLLVHDMIIDWRRQVRIPLHVNGKHIGDYIADFLVIEGDGNEWFEDTKGYKTSLFKWKAKHFAAEYPDKILKVF